MESEVSQVLEDAVATVAGIDELRSISSDGMSIVMVTFNLSRNLDAAAQDVRDAVASVAMGSSHRLRNVWSAIEGGPESSRRGLGPSA